MQEYKIKLRNLDGDVLHAKVNEYSNVTIGELMDTCLDEMITEYVSENSLEFTFFIRQRSEEVWEATLNDLDGEETDIEITFDPSSKSLLDIRNDLLEEHKNHLRDECSIDVKPC